MSPPSICDRIGKYVNLYIHGFQRFSSYVLLPTAGWAKVPGMRGSKRAKLHDVAARAGVSTATVSRFLNNPELVAKDTAERIREVVAELGYVPNVIAGSLASSRSNQIAVLLPYLRSSVVEEMIENLVEELEAAGFVVLLGLTGMDPDRTNAKLMAAIARRVEAVITTGPVPEPARTALLENQVTVIEAWGLPIFPVDVAIGFAHREAGIAIADYIHDRGYRRPHLITSRGVRAENRRLGFLEAWVQKRGLPHPSEEQVDIPADFGQARDIIATVQAMPQRPDVIVCGSDYLAQGVIVHAQVEGMKIPQDLAVIGFGNSGIAAQMCPSITSVAVDGRRIAREAIKVIAARAKGEEPPERRIDVGLSIMARESA